MPRFVDSIPLLVALADLTSTTYSTSRKVMAGLKSENQQHHLHLLFSRRMAPYMCLKPEQHNAVISAHLNKVLMREISKNMQIPERIIRMWAKYFKCDNEQHNLP